MQAESSSEPPADNEAISALYRQIQPVLLAQEQRTTAGKWQIARDVRTGYSKFSNGACIVVGDARPGAQERYETSRAGQSRIQQREAMMTRKGWLSLQSVRDPRRWKRRFFVCTVVDNMLKWFRANSEDLAESKKGWRLNLYGAQIIPLERLEYDQAT